MRFVDHSDTSPDFLNLMLVHLISKSAMRNSPPPFSVICRLNHFCLVTVLEEVTLAAILFVALCR
jgi:hypothetical protein